jgi:anti-sigma factor RsiW
MMIAPSRPAACLSDFALDAWITGDLAGDRVTAVREHLAGCARCSSRSEELRNEEAKFAAEPLPPVLASPRRIVPRQVRWFAAAGLLAAALFVLVVVPRRTDRDGERTKGSPMGFRFYVDHAGNVRPGGPDERVEPGDALRFVFSTSDARYLAVLSVDGARRASTYYPAAGGPALQPPGPGFALPASTVLDETLGRETIYGVACVAPFDVEALRRVLERAPDRPPQLDGCDVDAIVVRKEASFPQ